MNLISTAVVVDGTLWALVFLSALSWGVIGLKAWQRLRERGRNRSFLRAFRNSPGLSLLARQDAAGGALARVGQEGYAVLRAAAEHLHRAEQIWDRQDIVQRSLQQQIQRERKGYESWLAILATIGNVAPFVGLFGTVWGIMHALTGIAAKGSASIEVVAGPIGEALIATGIGIAVAIPAVIGYNWLQRGVKTGVAELEDFAADFLKLAQLNAFLLAPSHLAAVAERKEVA